MQVVKKKSSETEISGNYGGLERREKNLQVFSTEKYRKKKESEVHLEKLKWTLDYRQRR